MNAHAQLTAASCVNASHLLARSRMATPASVPNFVTGWTSRPMPFDTKKRGERARLSNKNAAVERIDPEAHDDGCLVYTARPLPLGCLWNMTVTTTSGVAKGLVSGGCMS